MRATTVNPGFVKTPLTDKNAFKMPFIVDVKDGNLKTKDLSPATVETHRTHLLQKLGLRNAAEVVLYAVRRGVIS